MAFKKSGLVLRSGKSRRQTFWLPIAATDSTLAAASTAALFTGFGAATLALRPFTIVRTRGLMSVRSDQQAASEVAHAFLAASIVSDEALAIGVTAVPTPADNPGANFFLYEQAMGIIRVVSAIGITEPTVQSTVFDSKAMRKVEEGQDIAMVIETSSVADAASVFKAGRILIKLH